MSALGDLTIVDLEKAMRELRRLWTDARDRSAGGLGVPPRDAFTPELLKPWLPNIVIVESVSAEDGRLRFRVRLAGTAAAGFGGRDLTGMFLDDAVAPGQYDLTIAPYLAAMTTRQPVEDDVHNQQFRSMAGARLPVRRLVMPCSGDGAAIDRFVVGLFMYRAASE